MATIKKATFMAGSSGVESHPQRLSITGSGYLISCKQTNSNTFVLIIDGRRISFTAPMNDFLMLLRFEESLILEGYAGFTYLQYMLD